MKRFIIALVFGLLVVSALVAQVKVDVQLMNVVATVVDKDGLYVADLNADDFIVEEDGKTQSIAHLSQSNDMPVSMGVALDTSGSMERKINTASRAVERFIKTIHADDDIFLLTFSDRTVIQQDFTSDRDKLAVALRRLSVGGGTALYDALDDSLRKIKKGQHDKKAILLITDGQDTSSVNVFDEATLSVRESEVLVYCVGISPASTPVSLSRDPLPRPGTGQPGNGPIILDPNGRGGGTTGRNPTGRGGRGGTISLPVPGLPGGLPIPIPGRRPEQFQGSRRPNGGATTTTQSNPDIVDMTVLKAFADASGGKAWLLSGNWSDARSNQVEDILDELASELRNQYSIGYYPTHPLSDGKWHSITIRTKNPRYQVRARKEYFGK